MAKKTPKAALTNEELEAREAAEEARLEAQDHGAKSNKAKAKKKKAAKLIDRLADVPKRVWTWLAIAAVVVMVAPIVWDFVKPSADVDLPEDPSGRVVIFDGADLLTDEEEALLKEAMLPVAEYGAVGFFTNPDTESVGNVSVWARSLYLATFGEVSGTCFCIDMWSRQLYIFSGNEVLKVITTSKAETITDNVYRMAGRGEYYACAAEVFREMAQLLQGDTIPSPMKHAGNALLAITCARLVVFVTANLRTRMQGADEKTVIHDAVKRVEMSPYRQTLVRETRHRHYESSGGGGGGGGGGGFSGGGGGGFSGGGGGHGF